MTVKELYDWANERGIESLDLEINLIQHHGRYITDRTLYLTDPKMVILSKDFTVRIGIIKDV